MAMLRKPSLCAGKIRGWDFNALALSATPAMQLASPSCPMDRLSAIVASWGSCRGVDDEKERTSGLHVSVISIKDPGAKSDR